MIRFDGVCRMRILKVGADKSRRLKWMGEHNVISVFMVKNWKLWMISGLVKLFKGGSEKADVWSNVKDKILEVH